MLPAPVYFYKSDYPASILFNPEGEFRHPGQNSICFYLPRDLHEPLASTPGSVSIYAGTLKKMDGTSSADFRKLSSKIALLTQTALHSGIRIPDDPVILTEGIRNNLFLNLKEATNNIIRHAGARNMKQ